jgi:hypothetical protein
LWGFCKSWGSYAGALVASEWTILTHPVPLELTFIQVFISRITLQKSQLITSITGKEAAPIPQGVSMETAHIFRVPWTLPGDQLSARAILLKMLAFVSFLIAENLSATLIGNSDQRAPLCISLAASYEAVTKIEFHVS